MHLKNTSYISTCHFLRRTRSTHTEARHCESGAQHSDEARSLVERNTTDPHGCSSSVPRRANAGSHGEIAGSHEDPDQDDCLAPGHEVVWNTTERIDNGTVAILFVVNKWNHHHICIPCRKSGYRGDAS